MNSKISIPELTALLALKSGQPKKLCEDFLKQFFSAVASCLEEGESVRIKELGTFKVTRVEARKSVNVTTGQEFEIPAHNRISFVASKELAAAVNAPFAAFEAVELADDLSEESLEKSVNGEVENDVVAQQSEDVSEPEESQIPADVAPDAVADSVIEEEVDEDIAVPEDDYEIEEAQEVLVSDSEGPDDAGPEVVESDSDSDSENIQPADTDEKPESKASADIPAPLISADTPAPQIAVATPSQDNIERLKPRKHRFGLGFLTGFGVAVLVGIIVWLALWVVSLNRQIKQSSQQTESVAAKTPAAEDNKQYTDTIPLYPPAQTGVENNKEIKPEENTAMQDASVANAEKVEDVAKTKPSDQTRYDRISKTRFLTTMAKEYYGNYEFWPYIYKANGNLGHPDRIRPGTRIKIPPLSAIGADPSNPRDIAAAKRMGAAIYASYGTPMGASSKSSKK